MGRLGGVKASRENGTGSKAARLTFHAELAYSLLWCLSHFRDGPTELSMVREKGGQAPCVAFFAKFLSAFARSQSPFLASVFLSNPRGANLLGFDNFA